MKHIPIILICSLLLFSCTWVKLTEKGEKTRVLDAAEVIDCRKLGKTTSVSKDVVAGIQRSKEKLQKELETLARNSAVDLKGDTVVPIGVPIDGKQVFEVYRCMP